MKQSETNFRDLDRIAVTIGPGSFTGVRVGLAAARGFGVATGVPVVGVSTLSVYAAPYLAANSKSSVIAAIDARHDHVFLQMFGPGGGTLISPRLARLSEAIRAASIGARHEAQGRRGLGPLKETRRLREGGGEKLE